SDTSGIEAGVRLTARRVKNDRLLEADRQLILSGGAGAGEGGKLDIETLKPGAGIDGPLGIPPPVGKHIEPAGIGPVLAFFPLFQVHCHAGPDSAKRFAELVEGRRWNSRHADQSLVDEGRALKRDGLR